MTEAMLFLQKTILLSYDPRPFAGGLGYLFGETYSASARALASAMAFSWAAAGQSS